MEHVDHESLLSLLIDCLKRRDVAEKRLNVCNATICAHVALLLQVPVVGIIANVVTCILTYTTSVALSLEALVDLAEVEGALNRMVQVQTFVDCAVAWLVTTLVRDAKVLNVLADIFETETTATGCHAEVDDDMVLSTAMAIVYQLIDSFKSLIAVLDGYCNNLTVPHGELAISTIF